MSEQSTEGTPQECSYCGIVSGRVKPRPHSTAEIGDPNNPLLCPECDREVSR